MKLIGHDRAVWLVDDFTGDDGVSLPSDFTTGPVDSLLAKTLGPDRQLDRILSRALREDGSSAAFVSETKARFPSGVEAFRFVEALWSANEELVGTRQPHARQRRWLLARFRYETLSELTITCCPSCLAGAVSQNANVGDADYETRKLLWDRVTDARLIWFRLLANTDFDPSMTLNAESEERAAKDLIVASRKKKTFIAADHLDLNPARPRSASDLDCQNNHKVGPFTWAEHESSGQLSTEEIQTVASIARTLLLPRYMLPDFARVITNLNWTVAVTIYLVVSATLSGLWAARLWNDSPTSPANWAPGLATVGLAAIAIAAARGSKLPKVDRLDPWCLRIPASTIVGAAAVLGFAPSWALNPTNDPVALGPAIAVALVAVYLYMTVEAASSGTGSRSLWFRSLLVLALGIGHALVITTAVLGTVGNLVIGASPSVTSDGSPTNELTVFLDEATSCHRIVALAALAASSLAIGIFLQVLWESDALTQPLARSRRRHDLD